MKTIEQGILAIVVSSLLASTFHTFAVEGLTLSVQCTNVVLSWPSASNETYIVQYRPTLDPGTPWQTLASSLPASLGTNLTVYVHSNIVQNANCSGGAGSFAAIAARGEDGCDSMSLTASESFVPLARPATGSGDAVPLALYPPGFDLSGFLVFDPSTAQWVNGSEYSTSVQSTEGPQVNDLQSQDDGSGGGDTPVNDSTDDGDPGFYRVVRNGVHLFGLTNGVVLSGTVDIPVEFSVSSTDEVAGLTFYADGAPLIGAAQSTNGAWVLEWNTSMITNGTFDINAEVDFDADDSVAGAPVTVTVSNLVSFPNYFTRIFGDWMWVYAQLATSQADFEIKMYDESANYLGSFFGSTSDGVISFLWDLTDGSGYTYTNESFRGEFYITPASEGLDPDSNGAEESGSANATQEWAKESNWSSADGFVIACASFSAGNQSTLHTQQMLSDGVINILYGSYVLSPGNPPWAGTAFQMYDAATRGSLMSCLGAAAYRNFYWFGHGTPWAIGGIQPGTVISYTDLSRGLTNLLGARRPANYHPYRFVFLDACQAGKCQFCEAFGIPAQTVNNAFFAGAGVRSRAFLGFKENTHYNNINWDGRASMLAKFFSDWLSLKTLSVCVSNAVHFYPPAGALDSSWVIYGATDLRRNSP